MKVCPACKAEHEGSQFRCPPCKRAYDRARWAKASEEQRRRIVGIKAARVDALRQRLWGYLLEHPCVDCGLVDPVVMEFDHQRDKARNVSLMVHAGWSWEKTLDEIAKCEVVCANCHRRRTAVAFGWFSRVVAQR